MLIHSATTARPSRSQTKRGDPSNDIGQTDAALPRRRRAFTRRSRGRYRGGTARAHDAEIPRTHADGRLPVDVAAPIFERKESDDPVRDFTVPLDEVAVTVRIVPPP